jgi:LPXTG-site transpeptidase (sortase) family protein
MRPSGTIYQKGVSHSWHGELEIFMPKKKRAIYGFFQGIGAGLVAVSIISIFFFVSPIAAEESLYVLRDHGIVEKPFSHDVSAKTQEAQTISDIQSEAQTYGVDSHFSVVIPAISAKAQVIPNVSTTNKSEYLDALTRGVAHAKGTNFPGSSKPIFLFSHSTDSPSNFIRYNAIFYLLRKLEAGDHIIIYFADKKYIYEVSELVRVDANDTSWLTNQADEEKLYLMTCDPPGTTLKRLLVIAKRSN